MLADAGANVIGQSLSTRGERGYVVTDTDVAPSDAALAALRQSPQTVWLRSWRGVTTTPSRPRSARRPGRRPALVVLIVALLFGVPWWTLVGRARLAGRGGRGGHAWWPSRPPSRCRC